MAFEIEVKKNAIQSTQFYIDNKVVKLNGNEIPVSEITGFGYYAIQQKSGVLNTGKLFIVFIYKKGEKKPVKLMGMYAFGGGSGNATFADIIENLWKYVGDNLLKGLHASLLKGEEVILDKGLRATAKYAFTAKPGLLKMGPEVPTEWRNITTTELLEDLIVRNKVTGKKVGLHNLVRNNVRLFARYCEWLLNNPDELFSLEQVANGTK